MNKTNILGIPICNVTMEVATNKLLEFLDSEKNHVVITPNPEIVMKAQNDRELAKIIKRASLVVPDGIGLVMASYVLKPKLPQRVAGIDLIWSFFAVAPVGTTVYLLGSKDGVAEKAKQNLEKKYANVKIVGCHSGFFDSEQEKRILDEISTLKPHVLLVGLGAPKQEKWLYKNRKLPVKISIGVGGAIDVMAGVVKRAPKLFISLNLEWFYRLITNPQRIVRMSVLPIFAIHVILNTLGRKHFERNL